MSEGQRQDTGPRCALGAVTALSELQKGPEPRASSLSVSSVFAHHCFALELGTEVEPSGLPRRHILDDFAGLACGLAAQPWSRRQPRHHTWLQVTSQEHIAVPPYA